MHSPVIVVVVTVVVVVPIAGYTSPQSRRMQNLWFGSARCSVTVVVVVAERETLT